VDDLREFEDQQLAPAPERADTRVPYICFAEQYADEKDEIHSIIDRVFSSGMFVGLNGLKPLENDLKTCLGTRNVVAVSSGTEALFLGLKALDIGPGDEVITQANSHFSTVSAIIHAGAEPLFTDVLENQNMDPTLIEAAITPRTRAIMPVHLTGRAAEMGAICEVADKHGLAVIEDAAQSVGAKLDNQCTGTFGQIGAFSAHPLKNLNAAGDAGFVVTDDDSMASRLGRLRHNGLKDRDTADEWAYVARMDILQAEIVRMRLKKLGQVIEARRRNASLYRATLCDAVYVPSEQEGAFDTHHTFVVQVDRRDELRAYLSTAGISSYIHYPVPLHLQPAMGGKYEVGSLPKTEAQAGRVISLPIHQYLSKDQIHFVSETINGFFNA